MIELYSPKQWLLIDLASMYGLDKKEFDERLQWGRDVLPDIQKCTDIVELKAAITPYLDTADEPEMFTACSIAIWDAVNGTKNGYVLGLDAASSGPQLLSLLTRCIVGMMNTGAIGSVVPDLYTTILANVKGFNTTRTKVKKATVPYVYGSKATPEKVFTDHYPQFVAAYAATVPGAEWAKNELINSWDERVTYHQWVMPDGAIAYCTVVGTKDTKGPFGGFTYTYRHDVITPKDRGEEGTKSNAANVTHSYDAYVLREMHRRCDYDPIKVHKAITAINHHLEHGSNFCNLKLRELSALAQRFNTVSVVGLEFIRKYEMSDIPTEYLTKLRDSLSALLCYQPFQLRTIHDEFGSLANHTNRMRYWYNEIIVEAYESTWLMDTIEDLTGVSHHSKLAPVDPNISQLIRENKYAIN